MAAHPHTGTDLKPLPCGRKSPKGTENIPEARAKANKKPDEFAFK
jgi:hypothetical protein